MCYDEDEFDDISVFDEKEPDTYWEENGFASEEDYIRYKYGS